MCAADLVQVLRGLPSVQSENLLIGNSGGDDGCALLLPDGRVMVQTLDFFTPIVDDPYTFGQIAAANAISDIYAMGATPAVALNIVAFPVNTLGLDVLHEVLRGGADKAAEANMPVPGGHSIDDAEPKYGMAVTGFAESQDQLLSNEQAKAGDVLVLTKPIGVGVMTTAIKKGKASEAEMKAAIDSMAQLNKAGGEAARAVSARCATDITGFGLIGHVGNIARGSGVQIEMAFGDVPFFDEALDLARQDVFPGGTRKNLKFYGDEVDWKGSLEDWQKLLLSDAQTSGGMAIAVPEDRADELIQKLTSAGALCAQVFARVSAGSPGISVLG